MLSRSIMMLSLVCALSWVIVSTAIAGYTSSEKTLREYYDVQEGKRLYEQYCRFCHGEQGKGKAYDVTPPPADLTSPDVQQKSDFELAKTIHGGERGTAMGAWQWLFSEQDKQHVLLYIRSLAR